MKGHGLQLTIILVTPPRFSQSMWMSGIKRGDIGMDAINEELRVAFLDPKDEDQVINAAQLEWAPKQHQELIVQSVESIL